MAAPEGYDTPTIPGTDALADRKAWFETGDGKPVKPTGYDSMAADAPEKVAYDSSVTQNTADIAAVHALLVG